MSQTPSTGLGDARDTEMNDPGLAPQELTVCQGPGRSQELREPEAQTVC